MINIISKYDAVTSLVGGSLSQPADGIIRYFSGQTPPTQAEIDAEVIRLQSEWDALSYSRARAETFPELKEQLDLLFHDMSSGKGTKDGEWYKAILKVKTDNPKPE